MGNGCPWNDRPWASLCPDRYRQIAWYHPGFWPHESSSGYFRQRSNSSQWATSAWAAEWRREKQLRAHMQKKRLLGELWAPRAIERAGSRLLYIDLGANKPSTSVEGFAAWYPDGGQFHITAFEPNPKFAREYKLLERQRPESFRFYPAAVGTSEDDVFLHVGENSLASSVRLPVVDTQSTNQVTPARARVVRARQTNLTAFLLRHIRPDDFVVVKMDIEGSEHLVLPALVRAGVAPLIDELFLECHPTTHPMQAVRTENGFYGARALIPESPIVFNPPEYPCLSLMMMAQDAGMWVREHTP